MGVGQSRRSSEGDTGLALVAIFVFGIVIWCIYIYKLKASAVAVQLCITRASTGVKHFTKLCRMLRLWRVIVLDFSIDNIVRDC